MTSPRPRTVITAPEAKGRRVMAVLAAAALLGSSVPSIAAAQPGPAD